MPDEIPQLKYQAGDNVLFKFKPDHHGANETTLVGYIDGLLYEERCYLVQIRDKKRGITGRLCVPEASIEKKIE